MFDILVSFFFYRFLLFSISIFYFFDLAKLEKGEEIVKEKSRTKEKIHYIKSSIMPRTY